MKTQVLTVISESELVQMCTCLLNSKEYIFYIVGSIEQVRGLINQKKSISLEWEVDEILGIESHKDSPTEESIQQREDGSFVLTVTVEEIVNMDGNIFIDLSLHKDLPLLTLMGEEWMGEAPSKNSSYKIYCGKLLLFPFEI